MPGVFDDIMEHLQIDLVSHGWVDQFAQSGQVVAPLEQLLESGRVHIGETRLVDGRVHFIAWRGSVDERVRRALKRVEERSGNDKDYSYWLCLAENINGFE